MKILVTDIVGAVCMTREDGQRLHDAFRPMLDRGEQIVLDFSGTTAFVSAFFNTAIGQLFERYTRQELGEKVKLVNVPSAAAQPLVKSIDAAERYYHDKTHRDAVDRVLASNVCAE